MINEQTNPTQFADDRSVKSAMWNGARSRCPNCGEGKLFSGFVAVEEKCGECGEEMFHHRADDLPPYLNIFIVGHVVVLALMFAMKYEIAGMWTIAIGGSLLCVAVALMLMRPLKGMVIGIQWANRMHGFGGDES